MAWVAAVEIGVATWVVEVEVETWADLAEVIWEVEEVILMDIWGTVSNFAFLSRR